MPFVTALLCFVLVWEFIFDVKKINGLDMKETYQLGDALLIKKSFNKYKINDVVYIHYPNKNDSLEEIYFFQRIIGLPGDSLEIINKEIFINGHLKEEDSTIKHNYHLKIDNKKNLESTEKLNYNLLEGCTISEKNDFSFSLTKSDAINLKKQPFIETIELEKEEKNNVDLTCFPYSYNYKWNSDNYGKLYIPKMNDTLLLDTINIVLYKNLIQDYESNSLEIKHDSILINNKLTNFYVVKSNYYFFLGDNRDNAIDSRKWGFLPENYIIGKAIWLLKKSKK